MLTWEIKALKSEPVWLLVKILCFQNYFPKCFEFIILFSKLVFQCFAIKKKKINLFCTTFSISIFLLNHLFLIKIIIIIIKKKNKNILSNNNHHSKSTQLANTPFKIRSIITHNPRPSTREREDFFLYIIILLLLL